MHPRRALLAALAWVAVAGCKVIVLGDSNSCMGLPGQCAAEMWPERLQQRLDQAQSLWLVENRGTPGMTAGPFTGDDGKALVSGLTGEPSYGLFHLDRLVRDDDLAGTCRFVPFRAVAPRLVVALGTNDIGRAPAAAVVGNVLALGAHAVEVAPCVRVYYATIPPRFDATFHEEPQRLMANALLRVRVPPERLIDFDTGFGRADFTDGGIHLNGAGQAKRAEAAIRTLFPGLAS